MISVLTIPHLPAWTWERESRMVWWGNASLGVLPWVGLCEIKPGKEKKMIWGWRRGW